MKYIAFLRGVNIGTRKALAKDLQQAFEALGCSQIKTLLASGNVVFSTHETNESLLQKNIEEKLENSFGFAIPVLLRTQEDLMALVAKDPFAYAQKEKGTRLQVTFLENEVAAVSTVEKDGFIIFPISKRELGSIVAPSGKTTTLMTYIDKTFGKESTTRNWHTLQKLAAV